MRVARIYNPGFRTVAGLDILQQTFGGESPLHENVFPEGMEIADTHTLWSLAGEEYGLEVFPRLWPLASVRLCVCDDQIRSVTGHDPINFLFDLPLPSAKAQLLNCPEYHQKQNGRQKAELQDTFSPFGHKSSLLGLFSLVNGLTMQVIPWPR